MQYIQVIQNINKFKYNAAIIKYVFNKSIEMYP